MLPADSAKSKRPLILLLGALAALGPLSIDMYLPSFQAIERDLHTTPSLVSGTMATYFVGLCLGQLLYGPWSDRVGRKTPLLAGIALYLLASLGCTVVGDIRILLLLRFFQALGACSGMVVGRAMIRDLFPPHETSKVFSLVMLVMGVSPILAPLLGQLVADVAGWRGNFAFMTLFAAAVWLAVLLRVPTPTSPPASPSPTSHSLGSRFASVFRDPNFVAYAVSGTLIQGGLYAYVSGSAELFMGALGISPKAYSLLFGANAAGLILAAQANAKLLDRYDYPVLLSRAINVAAAAAVVLAATVYLPVGLGVIAPLFVFMACQGLIFPNAAAGALAEQGHQAGTASAVLGCLQYGGAALASGLVSLLHRWTEAPMQTAIGLCGVAGWLAFQRLSRGGDGIEPTP